MLKNILLNLQKTSALFGNIFKGSPEKSVIESSTGDFPALT